MASLNALQYPAVFSWILAVLGFKFRVNYIHVNRELMLFDERERFTQKEWLLKRSRYFHSTLSLHNRRYWAEWVIISKFHVRVLLFMWLRKKKHLLGSRMPVMQATLDFLSIWTYFPQLSVLYVLKGFKLWSLQTLLLNFSQVITKSSSLQMISNAQFMDIPD